jgi:type 1 fimbriae regulatory protein FimB/type 1 fimbriae regulatory protein FimE
MPVMTQPLFSAKCPPQKPYNAMRRSREYLTHEEVEHLLRAARRQGRCRQRNATLMLLMYRHGLRVAELVRLRWEMFDLKAALFHVQRVKNGVPSVHPLRGAELRALRQLHVTGAGAAYLFVSERGGPLTTRTVHHIVAAAGEAAGLPFPVHPHMLRHACGFYLANKGVDTRALQQYLGHRNIQHTVRYTELTPQRFQDFWND